MNATITMKIFGGQKGVIDTDADGKKLTADKHIPWANVLGLDPVKNDDLAKAGNSIAKLPCSHECFDDVRKNLHPGEFKEFAFECEMRPGAKQKMQLFGIKATPVK